MDTPQPHLSRVRSFMFGALIIVWFSEMTLWGFQALARVWTNTWVTASDDPRLASALYITHSVHSPAKGALGVMAIYGLMSKSPLARTALFASMALVPPLNMLFPFRAQGFPLTWVVLPTIFSLILWGSFFLFREHAAPPESRAMLGPASRREKIQTLWFGVNAAGLTLLASLFLFRPFDALLLAQPCFASWLDEAHAISGNLTYSDMATGTHLLALSIGTWLATVYGRRSPALRNAMAVASTVHAGLFILFPLRQITMELGSGCAASSILIAFVPLFVGWAVYLIYDATHDARAAPVFPHARASGT